MLKSILLPILTLTIFQLQGQIISLYSGGGGTTQPGQSYNETRCAEVKPLEDLEATEITLLHFNAGDKGFVGLRIYDAATNALLLSEDREIPPGINQSISFPVSFSFSTTKTYRVGFYAHAGPSPYSLGSFTAYVPTFPYTEAENLMKVTGGYQNSNDAYPSMVNIFIPHIQIKYTQKTTPTPPCPACNCKLIYALLIIIILLLLFLIWSFFRRRQFVQ